jgi:hypothetical protein
MLQWLGHEVVGIEPNKGYADYSSSEYGLTIQVGLIQDIQQPIGRFDLITIWHVLEHTEDPFAVMSKLHALLKTKGVLAVEVPSIEATCQSPKTTFHEAHLFHFNTDTLCRLGEKAGFAVRQKSISADGGNITVLFQKDLAAAVPIGHALEIPGNAARVIKVVNGHTAWRHHLTTSPYKRLFYRLCRAVNEKYKAVNFATGKQLLDRLYSLGPDNAEPFECNSLNTDQLG